MLDQTTPKGRILSAALDCAAKKSWSDVTLLDVAEAANLPLGDLRGQFDTKDDVKIHFRSQMSDLRLIADSIGQ